MDSRTLSSNCLGSQRPYTCKSFDVPITVNDIPTLVLPWPPLEDQYQATNILNLLTSRTPPNAPPQLINLTGTYIIAAQFCSPDSTTIPTSSTLQILTHGIGFNSSYWDFYPTTNLSDATYSYIAAATAAGYTTLSYNRLGIAGSTLADPHSEVQSPVELAILAQLTSLAKASKLPTQTFTPSKVIHVGHSYGSILTNALVAISPSLSDGVVLTGYSHLLAPYSSLFLASTNLLIANQANPALFPPIKYPNEYITWPNPSANQYNFFAYPQFSTDILLQAEATKQPFTLGEFATFGALNLTAPSFTGPVLYVNAEKDLIFCGSNCTGLIEKGTPAFDAFSGTEDIESVIIAGAGHGLNLHYSAPETYGTIVD